MTKNVLPTAALAIAKCGRFFNGKNSSGSKAKIFFTAKIVLIPAFTAPVIR